MADVMPGTTSNGTPASARAAASSPPRANTNGSPPFSRTTVPPARPRSTSSALMSAWGIVTRPGALPTLIRSACGGASSSSASTDSRSYTTTSARRSTSSARTVSSPGSPGPAPTRYTVMPAERVGGDLAVAEVLEQLLDHMHHQRRVVPGSDLQELEPVGVGRVDPGVDGGQVGLDLDEARPNAIVELGDRRRGGELGVAVAVGRAADADMAEPELGDAAAVDHEARHRVDVRCDRTLVHALVAQPIGDGEHLVEGQARVAGSSGRRELHAEHGNAGLVRHPRRLLSRRAGRGAPRRSPCRPPDPTPRRWRARSSVRRVGRGTRRHGGRRPRSRAWAPAGSEQSPPSSARKARSASTHRRVGRCSRRASSARRSSSPSRHSTASAA